MELSARKHHGCTFCSCKSSRITVLKQHIRHHTRGKSLLCDKCKREFSFKNLLKVHLHSGRLIPTGVQQEKYKCSLCPYETPHKNSVDVHIIRMHTGERSYPCQHANCDYAAKSSQNLKDHSMRRHSVDRNFICLFPNCGYRGKTKKDTSQHFATHSEKIPFSCDIRGCNYRAKQKNKLKSHKLVVHHGGYKPFACSMCNYRTTTKTLLREHESRHSEEKPIKCDFNGCTYSFKAKSGLRQHVVLHHTEKTFRCDFVGCSATAVSRLLLENHKRNVHSEKIYKCSNCDFETKYELPFQNHQERHNKARQRMPCPYKGCTFRSIHQDSFKRHLASHKANLGCQEEGCGYVGRSSSSLKHHMQLHDPTGRPFHCAICSKHFFTNNHLRIHLRTHTEEQPFKCPLCNFGTVNRGNMVRHVRTIHATTVPEFGLDKKSTCAHCHVNFGCALGLAMHRVKLKTAIVVLKRFNIS